jgi:anti-sigma regulatory factor (Ser/Thr protein kinase)
MPVTKTFKISNSTQSQFTSLRWILDFINSNLPRNCDAAEINFKLKSIITELLNNAIKHPGNVETALHILIDNEHIKIDKTDQGKRFNPNNLIPIPNEKSGYSVQLSSDALNSVYAYIETEEFIKFYSEDNNSTNPFDINEIDEHFGLLIISKSADEFTYHHDKQSGLNTFSINLKLF